MTWDDALAKLDGFRTLRDDWDGDGSPAPVAEVIRGAIKVAEAQRLANIVAPDRVIVGVNGTIHFEWFAGRYVEVEVTEQGIEKRVVE